MFLIFWLEFHFMTFPTLAGGKSQQFAISKIDKIFTFYKPKPPLSKFVDRFWLYEGYNAEGLTLPILPTGKLELAINLRQDEMRFHDSDVSESPSRFSAAVVSGAHGRSFVPAAREELCVIGVHFKPGGAFPFLGVPVSDLADTHIDLDILWGPLAGRLRERLYEAGSSAERFHLVEAALLKRLYRGREPHYAIPAALEIFANNHGGPVVREAAKNLGLSQRRFIQVFKTEVGMTPKLFSRIQRFQKSRLLIHGDPSPDWASLAIDLGYFDQSHLINEFREFSGVSPTDYVDRRNSLIEYLNR
jgi:AraC-like DNA-binding protein